MPKKTLQFMVYAHFYMTDIVLIMIIVLLVTRRGKKQNTNFTVKRFIKCIA